MQQRHTSAYVHFAVLAPATVLDRSGYNGVRGTRGRQLAHVNVSVMLC